MTPFENLRVGSWVAIIATNPREPQVIQQGPLMMMKQQEPLAWESVDGRPYQIQAISLPFMALYCPVNQHVFPIDYRRCELQLLEENYVRIFKTATMDQRGLHPVEKVKDIYRNTPREQFPIADEDESTQPNVQNLNPNNKAFLSCPRCGSPMSRLLHDSFVCTNPECRSEPTYG